jgi:hypothetical protein
MRVGLVGRDCARPRNNAFEASRRSLTPERAGRRDVLRSRGILGKKRGNPVMFVRLEKPVGKSRKIEKARDFVLGSVAPAALAPQVAIRRPVRQFFPFLVSSAHRKRSPHLIYAEGIAAIPATLRFYSADVTRAWSR